MHQPLTTKHGYECICKHHLLLTFINSPASANNRTRQRESKSDKGDKYKNKRIIIHYLSLADTTVRRSISIEAGGRFLSVKAFFLPVSWMTLTIMTSFRLLNTLQFVSDNMIIMCTLSLNSFLSDLCSLLNTKLQVKCVFTVVYFCKSFYLYILFFYISLWQWNS